MAGKPCHPAMHHARGAPHSPALRAPSLPGRLSQPRGSLPHPPGRLRALSRARARGGPGARPAAHPPRR
eukprot:scaffold5066_cov403-Prasinococcus_capsulatus_cf.AAC.7